MRFDIAAKGDIVPAMTADQMDALVDGLMEALLELGVVDPAVSGTISEACVEVEMVLDANDRAAAVGSAAELLGEAMRMLGAEPVGDDLVITARRELAGV